MSLHNGSNFPLFKNRASNKVNSPIIASPTKFLTLILYPSNEKSGKLDLSSAKACEFNRLSPNELGFVFLAEDSYIL